MDEWKNEVKKIFNDRSVRRCYHDPTVLLESSKGRCSKCSRAFYFNKEAQKAHWNLHKQVCGVPDLDEVAQMDAAACVAALRMQLCGAFSKDTALVIHRLGYLLVQGEVENADEVGYEIHTMTRITLMSEAQAEQYYSTLWAVPGMVQVLLAAPLLSRTTLQMEALEVAAEAEGREVSEMEHYELEMQRYSDTGAHQFAFLLFNLLVRSAVAPSGALAITSNHDGRGLLRRNNFSIAAAARSVTLWLDSRVRSSCGDALASGASFVASFVAAQPGELPALLASGLVKSCLEEARDSGAGAGRYCRTALLSATNETLSAVGAWDLLRAGAYALSPGMGGGEEGPGAPTALAVCLATSALAAIEHLEHLDEGQDSDYDFDAPDEGQAARDAAACHEILRQTLSRDGLGVEIDRSLLRVCCDASVWATAAATDPPLSAVIPSYSVGGSWARAIKKTGPDSHVRAKLWWLLNKDLQSFGPSPKTFGEVVGGHLKVFEELNFKDSAEKKEAFRACMDDAEWGKWNAIFDR